MGLETVPWESRHFVEHLESRNNPAPVGAKKTYPRGLLNQLSGLSSHSIGKPIAEPLWPGQ
jgi:hypothetical protein